MTERNELDSVRLLLLEQLNDIRSDLIKIGLWPTHQLLWHRIRRHIEQENWDGRATP